MPSSGSCGPLAPADSRICTSRAPVARRGRPLLDLGRAARLGDGLRSWGLGPDPGPSPRPSPAPKSRNGHPPRGRSGGDPGRRPFRCGFRVVEGGVISGRAHVRQRAGAGPVAEERVRPRHGVPNVVEGSVCRRDARVHRWQRRAHPTDRGICRLEARVRRVDGCAHAADRGICRVDGYAHPTDRGICRLDGRACRLDACTQAPDRQVHRCDGRRTALAESTRRDIRLPRSPRRAPRRRVPVS